VDGALGEAFASRQGVKQGCPLSTEVFGPFIEAFANYVDASDRALALDSAHTVADSPMVNGHSVPALMFADDLTLMALSVGRAQWLLDRLAEFCEACGMRVNRVRRETGGPVPRKRKRNRETLRKGLHAYAGPRQARRQA
jgi:hypothetical protein